MTNRVRLGVVPVDDPVPVNDRAPVDNRRTVLVTVGSALLLGVLDLLLQKTLPHPLANLANSGAVWAVPAFLLGWWLRGPWWRCALAGAALLVVAVPAYYVSAWLIQNDDLSVAWAPTSLWMIFGLIAGAVFGTAGSWARSSGWWRLVGIASPGAVLAGEALTQRAENVSTAFLELALGVLVSLLVGRTARERLIAPVLSLPLGVIAYAGFALGGMTS
jgi:hypothetical protein